MNNSKQKLFAGYGCEDVDPRGFVSLMDLYENNYMRIRRLLPELAKLPDTSVSHLPGCLSLHLVILERTKFTTTLCLTYQFGEHSRPVPEPALTLRVYHDVHQAEVLTGHLQHGRNQYDHVPEKAIQIKWKLNRFLFKWLGYCLYLGHQFPVSKSASISEHKLLNNMVEIVSRVRPK
ncbi:MAG: hypothetical protein COA54_04985 [Thiotrichaceae bacterium]|nr:MAG: hypothetical protein COA54_04985 [Thiotrichaceae bacterium]